MDFKLEPFSFLSKNKNSIKHVLPVAIISLKDQVDRRKKLIERNIPVLWVNHYLEAADFRFASQSQVQDVANTSKIEALIKREVCPSEIGCAFSHQKAHHWLAKSNFDLMLVLEDDVIPEQPNFEVLVAQIAQFFFPTARKGLAFIVHLGAPENQIARALKRKVYSVSSQSSVMPKFFMHSDPDKRLWRAHAYLLSKGAAIKAQKLEPKLVTLADDWNTRREMGILDAVFYSHPKIFSQDEDISSNIGSRGEDREQDIKLVPAFFHLRVYHAINNGNFFRQSLNSALFRAHMLYARILSNFPVFLR